MKTVHLLLTGFLVSVLTACENNIPYDVANNPSKLIVNAIIDASEKEHIISISKTGRYDTDSIRNAIINIYINDLLKEQLTEPFLRDSSKHPFPSADYHPGDYTNDTPYRTTLQFRPGDKVRIEVFADDHTYHAWAEDIVPQPVEIGQIDTMTYTTDDYHMMRMRTTITDDPTAKNFYRLALLKKTTTYIRNKETGLLSEYLQEEVIELDTREDFILNDGKVVTDDGITGRQENALAVFDDTRMQGTETLTTHFERIAKNYYSPGAAGFERESIAYNVYLISITEIQYYYLKALNALYSFGYDEYLSTPVAFPSNIQGGVGFVGFSASTCKSFSIPDITPTPLE